MSDYIDRGAAVIAVKCGSLSARTVYGRTDEGMAVLKETLTAIKELPAVDAVEVIRCKDCKWFNDLGCAIRIVDDSDKPKGSDFCSFAERRQE